MRKEALPGIVQIESEAIALRRHQRVDPALEGPLWLRTLDAVLGTRSFGGTINTSPDKSKAQFVGREATIQGGRPARLRLNSHWPKTISVLNPTPQLEKGEPHGAATLLRAANNAQSQLRISWAVFLPISEAADIVIPVGATDFGQFHLLLHGYFFLDSGRRHIEALTAQATDVEPSDAAGLRRAWNVELRDSVVLPLVPAVLRSALDSKIVTSAGLAELVAAVANSPWFHSNRKAICKESALARVLEAPSGIIWRLVPSGTTLRPLPKTVADAPGRIGELFADMPSWAQTRKLLLCIDKSASLTAEPMRWTADDLGSLFSVLKIKDFGYSASRVLFELFQNADDAYSQQAASLENVCFRVEVASDGVGGFRVIHWGRPINHLGSDSNEGRRLGHDRDLLNMLLMNFSEKRPGEDLTGKFGLGFKSVHVLSDSVGIASGFIALRTLGGFVPMSWPTGIDEAEARKQAEGRKATVIDVPFSADTAGDGEEAVQAFRASMTWMPAFARSIRRIEIVDNDPVSIDCANFRLLEESAIHVVTISGTRRQRALRFDLTGRYSLLLRIESAGPGAFPDDLRRLWNLAPLEEDLRSGWLINGPFAVDPGRGRLAGSIEDRQDLFRKLGRTLGERLVKLHDLAAGDWNSFAVALDLDASEHVAMALFWSRSLTSSVPTAMMISLGTFILMATAMDTSPPNAR
jgi:hypothetical protein